MAVKGVIVNPVLGAVVLSKGIVGLAGIMHSKSTRIFPISCLVGILYCIKELLRILPLSVGTLAQDRTFMDTIKTYPINVEAVTLRTYSISAGRLPAAQTGSVTVKLNTSIVMLPKEPMQPRFADDSSIL